MCCRCSGGGKCKNCACVKAKQPCSTCLPARRGHCSNIKQPDASFSLAQPQALYSAATAGSSLPVMCLPSPPPLNPSIVTVPPSPVQSLPASPKRSIPFIAHPLPSFTPLAAAAFAWHDWDPSTFITSISAAYSEVVHWKKNIFQVPFGQSGKKFVLELSRLFRAYSEGSALECVALKAITVLSILALQKTSRKAKSKELSSCLDRRMSAWANGDITSLVEEGRCLQKRLHRGVSRVKRDDNLIRSFSNLMFEGKTGAALDLLSNKGKGGILHAGDLAAKDNPDNPAMSVLDVLKSKHPVAQHASSEALLSVNQETLEPHPVIFDRIDASSIRTAALNTKGAAGPSGLDAHCWRRHCTSFHSASKDLCHSLALFTRHLCVSLVDPRGLSAFLACRLIALDKCPGIRPIGICETACRIIAKAILYATKGDVQDAAGARQLCAGQIAGIEAAIHSVTDAFHSDDVEAVLLVDASNAFNSLNREVALRNIQIVCPALAKILINTYREPTELFVDGITLISEEGTTQGDPLAMPFYALATVPLINRLDVVEDLKQVWYADDASASGSIASVHAWWDQLSNVGPAFGYNANPVKCWLLTKEQHLDKAKEIFQGTSVNITTHGRPYLGAPLGTSAYVQQFVKEKVDDWILDLKLLSDMPKPNHMLPMRPSLMASCTNSLSCAERCRSWTCSLVPLKPAFVPSCFLPLLAELPQMMLSVIFSPCPPDWVALASSIPLSRVRLSFMLQQ